MIEVNCDLTDERVNVEERHLERSGCNCERRIDQLLARGCAYDIIDIIIHYARRIYSTCMSELLAIYEYAVLRVYIRDAHMYLLNTVTAGYKEAAM